MGRLHHVDYLHDGHAHHGHGDHYDECTVEGLHVGAEAHEHSHADGCGHEAGVDHRSAPSASCRPHHVPGA
ncbi:hypothetical protein RB614_36140 [Phytohabitans sp. ZYX-F-186]|uniref:Threonine dehydratase n=1 Tax=Phytohabitans maris TaxID=3071409 RepID=A0ABU0ZSD7_9ACTN|nr:hypothetical protein [Phytohabitans sp. ZYX-F-186]MDQ7909943.1 hypothetical protein [Phytohabitans sp. ZYX-F-186]